LRAINQQLDEFIFWGDLTPGQKPVEKPETQNH
jgi:hypothetical protein